MAEHPVAPDDPESGSGDAHREERERQFTRRRILEVGWTVPVVALTSQVGGQVILPPFYSGMHFDFSAHLDGVTHLDADQAHEDAQHLDSGDRNGHIDETGRGYHVDGGHDDVGINHLDSGHHDSSWDTHLDGSQHHDHTGHADGLDPEEG